MTSPLQQTLEGLFAANRILAGDGVIDGFGHVSVRNPIQPDRARLYLTYARITA